MQVLHAGCGNGKLPLRFEGWGQVRLDIDPDTTPDIVASMASMPAVASGSVDAVYSSHALEHLHAHEVLPALGEFWRVLRSGGFVLLNVPDLQAAALYIMEDRLDERIPLQVGIKGPSAHDLCYGHGPSIASGNPYMAHHTGFTARSLGEHLAKAGFSNVEVTRTGLDLWAEARKR
jgi:SAM-dependent methyltransferase